MLSGDQTSSGQRQTHPGVRDHKYHAHEMDSGTHRKIEEPLSWKLASLSAAAKYGVQFVPNPGETSQVSTL